MQADKRKKSIVDRAVDAFDLPGEVLAGVPKLTVTGNSRLHIESHRGLVEYDSSLIAINGGPVVIRVRGADMDICSMSSEELLIKGSFTAIEFE